jgi:NifU-like protein
MTRLYWKTYSRKLAVRIDHPKNAGFFKREDFKGRGIRLVIGTDGQLSQGNLLSFYLLIDENDGVIADAKFQAFGPPLLSGIADVACEVLLRKNYDQAKRIGADLLDKQLRDTPQERACSDEEAFLFNRVIDAIEDAASQCSDIPFADTYVNSPIATDELLAKGEGYPGWQELTTVQKLALIEQVIANDIRPYVELDAGGVQVLNFINDQEVIIGYAGSCTTCYSATGSTLSAIQQILRVKLDPSLVVTPDLTSLLHK